MPNSWITHIKAYAQKNNLSYACALSNPECRSTYKKQKGLKEKPVKEKPVKEKQALIIGDTKKTKSSSTKPSEWIIHPIDLSINRKKINYLL